VEFLTEYPTKAARIFAKIDRAIGNLGEMPEMYPVYQDLPAFRFITAEDYLVFYKVEKQSKIIEIHCLVYGRTDIQKHMS
jgi:plasmid stabilization system protein ParE